MSHSGQGVGLLIEAWKITKAVDIKLVQIPGRMLPKLDIKDKHVLSEDEKKTQEYDRLAFKSVQLFVLGALPLLRRVPADTSHGRPRRALPDTRSTASCTRLIEGGTRSSSALVRFQSTSVLSRADTRTLQ